MNYEVKMTKTKMYNIVQYLLKNSAFRRIDCEFVKLGHPSFGLNFYLDGFYYKAYFTIILGSFMMSITKHDDIYVHNSIDRTVYNFTNEELQNMGILFLK